MAHPFSDSKHRGMRSHPSHKVFGSVMFAVFAALVSPAATKPLDGTEAKIRLMAEALHAQDMGDYASAKSKLEALLLISPTDAQILRLLQNVNQHLAAPSISVPSSPTPTEVPTGESHPVEPNKPLVSQTEVQVPVAVEERKTTPNDPESLYAWEVSRQLTLLSEARARLKHGTKLVSEERYADAIEDFREADRLIPLNPATQPLRLEIDGARNDAEHRQRVAGFSQGLTAMKMTVAQFPIAAGVTPGPAEKDLIVDLHILEVPPDLYADLLQSWAELRRYMRTRGQTEMVLDRNGQVVYQRRASIIPTPRQLSLYWTLRAASLKLTDSALVQSNSGMVGLTGQFDVASLVGALSKMNSCRVLAAPRVVMKEGYQAVFSFSNESTPSQPQASLRPLGTSPTTGIELRLTREAIADGLDALFTVNPTVIQYEGRMASSSENPVFSRHEASGRIQLAKGFTSMMGGLVREEGRAISDEWTALHKFPLLGRMFRDRESALRQREILVFLTLR